MISGGFQRHCYSYCLCIRWNGMKQQLFSDLETDEAATNPKYGHSGK
jgi:hypothetical protein